MEAVYFSGVKHYVSYTKSQPLGFAGATAIIKGPNGTETI